MAELISIREYSRRRGCSDTAVHKSIKRGFIEESALVRDRYGKITGIDPELADKQWASAFKPDKAKNEKLAAAFAEIDVEPRQLPPRPPRPEPDPEPEQDTAEPPLSTAGAPSTAKAQQVEAVFKAKLRELEYRRKAGELISKDATYRALFALGQEIRAALQSIPDRTIDEILAAPTRNDAHTVLTREIHQVLERLASTQSIQTLEGL